MESESFVQGSLNKARELLKECAWWRFIRKAKIRGWIEACEVILYLSETAKAAADKMNCPKCKAEYRCPCNSCAKNIGPSDWRFDGDFIECACGFRSHCDYWLDREMKVYRKKRSAKATA